MNIPNDDKQIYLLCIFKLLLETVGTMLVLTNQSKSNKSTQSLTVVGLQFVGLKTLGTFFESFCEDRQTDTNFLVYWMTKKACIHKLNMNI